QHDGGCTRCSRRTARRGAAHAARGVQDDRDGDMARGARDDEGGGVAPRGPMTGVQASLSAPAGRTLSATGVPGRGARNGLPIRAGAGVAIGLLAGCLLLELVLLPIGVDDLDEGYFAQQAMRIVNGQIPYRDFESLYTPGLSYLHSALFGALGGPY